MTGERRTRGGGRGGRFNLVVGAALVPSLLFVALLAPLDPRSQDLEHRLAAPSTAHPLGLDELGRDILSRLLFGARVSVAVLGPALEHMVVALFPGLALLLTVMRLNFLGDGLVDLLHPYREAERPLS